MDHLRSNFKGSFSIAGAGFADHGDSGSAIVTDKLPATDPSGASGL